MLLLEDLVVLLQRQEEKLLLKCHSKTAVGSSDSKQTFSPVLKLNAVLIRSVATGTHESMSQQAWGSVVYSLFTIHCVLGDVGPYWGFTRLMSSCVSSCVPILTQSKQEDLVQDGQAKGWIMDQDENAQAEMGLKDTDGWDGCTVGG